MILIFPKFNLSGVGSRSLSLAFLVFSYFEVIEHF